MIGSNDFVFSPDFVFRSATRCEVIQFRIRNLQVVALMLISVRLPFAKVDLMFSFLLPLPLKYSFMVSYNITLGWLLPVIVVAFHRVACSIRRIGRQRRREAKRILPRLLLVFAVRYAVGPLFLELISFLRRIFSLNCPVLC